MRTDQEYRNLEAENTRLTAEIERLTKERDEARRTVKMAHEEGTRQIATLQARIDELEAKITEQAAEIERERTARKTAQESLEKYKGECTRLQHEVDRLKGEARLINRREHEATELRPAL